MGERVLKKVRLTKLFYGQKKGYSINNIRSSSSFLIKTNRTWFWCPNNSTVNIPCFSCNSWNFKEICRIWSQVSHHKTDGLFPHRADLIPCQCAGWMCSAEGRRDSTEGWRGTGGTPQKRFTVLLRCKGNCSRNNHMTSLGKHKKHNPFFSLHYKYYFSMCMRNLTLSFREKC